MTWDGRCFFLLRLLSVAASSAVPAIVGAITILAFGEVGSRLDCAGCHLLHKMTQHVSTSGEFTVRETPHPSG